LKRLAGKDANSSTREGPEKRGWGKTKGERDNRENGGRKTSGKLTDYGRREGARKKKR